MELFSRKTGTTGFSLLVSCTVHEDKCFFVSAVCTSVLRLIYHGANPVVHLCLPTTVFRVIPRILELRCKGATIPFSNVFFANFN